MAGREINLLPEETFLEKEKVKRRQKSIFGSTVLVTILFLIVILSSFGYSFYLQNQASSIKQKTELEKQKISHMKGKESQLLALKTKILAIEQLLAVKPLYEAQLKSLDLVSGIASEGAVLADYSFSGKTADFSVLVRDSNFSEDFINRLSDENSQQALFTDIKIDSVDSQKDGGYKLSFTVTVSGQAPGSK